MKFLLLSGALLCTLTLMAAISFTQSCPTLLSPNAQWFKPTTWTSITVCTMTHTVQSGETCDAIANACGVSLSRFLSFNGMAPNECCSKQIGQQLRCPSNSCDPSDKYVFKSSDTCPSIMQNGCRSSFDKYKSAGHPNASLVVVIMYQYDERIRRTLLVNTWG